jgi:hypothetical protein
LLYKEKKLRLKVANREQVKGSVMGLR